MGSDAKKIFFSVLVLDLPQWVGKRLAKLEAKPHIRYTLIITDYKNTCFYITSPQDIVCHLFINFYDISHEP